MTEPGIAWTHNPNDGACTLTLFSDSFERRFAINVAKPEKEAERVVRKLIRTVQRLDLGPWVVNQVIHTLDQIVARQREWRDVRNDNA
jgi:hypothetical protein